MQTPANSPGQLTAGIARVDISWRGPVEISNPLYASIDAKTINDPLYVKALALKNNTTSAVIITLDAVAVGEIGSIHNSYLAKVRARLQKELHIEPNSILINASHCHGVICTDIEERTISAVKEAWNNMVSVRSGAGAGANDKITENRRIKLKNGGEADVRRAYALPPDGEVAGVGPIDPQIGVLRLDRLDGRTLAVVYNFACHPIQGVPGGGNTADITGFASRVIEECLGDGTIAMFLQGCAGDINPVCYKAVDYPRDAEPLGNLLGLSTMRALQDIRTKEAGELKVVNEALTFPRADLTPYIAALQERQLELLRSLKGTTLNLKTFLPLLVKYHLNPDFPSCDAHHYLHEEMMGKDHLAKLDAENKRNLDLYIDNIYIMEEMTRVQANLDLLIMHHEQYVADGKDTIDVEVTALKIGDFTLVTFPGELSVEIGLDIKKNSPHKLTFVAGVTNGYIYYSPTSQQLENRGGAQEDSDCILSPEWQQLYEEKAIEMLKRL